MIQERLKEERKKRKITQAELSEKIGVSIPMLKDYESGKVSPKLSVFQKWCEALGFEIKVSLK